MGIISSSVEVKKEVKKETLVPKVDKTIDKDRFIVRPQVKVFSLKLYIQKKIQLNTNYMRHRPVEKESRWDPKLKRTVLKTKPYLLTSNSSIKTIADFNKWLLKKWGPGWYRITYHQKGYKGPLPFWFGEVTNKEYWEIKRKNDEDSKEIVDLKLERKESSSDPEYQDMLREEIEDLRKETRCKRPMMYRKYLIWFKPRFEHHDLTEKDK